MATCAGLFNPVVLSLSPGAPALPICNRKSPVRENFSTWASCGFGGAADAPPRVAPLPPPPPAAPPPAVAGAPPAPPPARPRPAEALALPGISGGPAAVIQTDWASTAIPPGDTGHWYLSPGPPQCPSRFPAASNSSTGGAGTQHSSAVFGVVAAPISVRTVNES